MSRESRVARGQAKAGVVIAYPHADKVDSSFHNCIVSLLMYDARTNQHVIEAGDVIALGSGPRIASARNNICTAFLVHPKKPPWILMLDTDMVFGPDLLEALLSHADPVDTPVLGGLCFAGGRSGKIEPTLRVATGKTNGDGPAFETVWDYPANVLCSVDQTGAAALLVHRSILEELHAKYGAIPYPFFVESSSRDNMGEFGEDVTFCLRIRGLGHPVKVHTGIKIGHMKPQVIDEETYLDYRRGITKMGEDEYIQHQRERLFLAGSPAQQVVEVQ